MAKDEPKGEWIDSDKMRGLRGRWTAVEAEPNIADLVERVAALEAWKASVTSGASALCPSFGPSRFGGEFTNPTAWGPGDGREEPDAA